MFVHVVLVMLLISICLCAATHRDTWKAAQVIKDKFNAKTFNVKKIQRGRPQTKELSVE